MTRAPLVGALALALTLVFFPGLRVYLGNHLFYKVSLAHVVVWLALGSFLAAGALAAIAAFAREPARRAIGALMLALAGFAWVKGAFLDWDYGLFVGSPVDWSRHVGAALADIGALAAFLVAALVLPGWLNANAARVAGFLVVAQAAALVALTPLSSAAEREAIFAKRSMVVEERRTEKVSDKANVILVLVDTLQSDVAAQWLAADRSRGEALRGFTFFRDAASAAGLTWLSVPNLLTGATFDNQQSYSRYREQAFFSAGSMLRNLRTAGYHVELVPWSLATPIPLDERLVSNVRERGWGPDLDALRSVLMVGAFTVLPQFAQQELHQPILAAVHDFLDPDSDNNLRFIRDVASLPVERIAQPVAKLIHLRGPHVPVLEYGRFGFDYEAAARAEPPAEAIEADFSRSNYVRVSQEMLGAVMRYLRKLDAAGAYERSSVFVFGDHGGGRLGQRFIAPGAPPYGPSAGLISSGLQAAAAPALLWKPAGASGALAWSDAPVALADIAATINRELGSARPGDHSLQAPVSRERRFLDVAQIRFDRNGRLPPLTEYAVGAPMWRDASWRRTGRRYLASGVRESDPPYRLGEWLDFGDGGRALDHVDYGWRVPLRGADSMWTDGRVARVDLPLSAPLQREAMLEADMGPYVFPRRVRISANGTALAELTIEDRRIHRFDLPPALAGAQRISLQLDLLDPQAPSRARWMADDGLLSLQVWRMRIRERPAP